MFTPIMNYQQEKLRTISFTIARKNKVPWNKFNQGSKRPILKNYKILKNEIEKILIHRSV